jgi:hypothetical protein
VPVSSAAVTCAVSSAVVNRNTVMSIGVRALVTRGVEREGVGRRIGLGDLAAAAHDCPPARTDCQDDNDNPDGQADQRGRHRKRDDRDAYSDGSVSRAHGPRIVLSARPRINWRTKFLLINSL